MISSEMPEILGMSHRIMVMHEGRVTGILDREQADQVKIMTSPRVRLYRGRESMPQALAQRTAHAGPARRSRRFPPEASILMVLLGLRWPLSYSAGSLSGKVFS